MLVSKKAVFFFSRAGKKKKTAFQIELVSTLLNFFRKKKIQKKTTDFGKNKIHTGNRENLKIG